MFEATLLHVASLSRLFYRLYHLGFEKGNKNGKQSTAGPDLNAKRLSGIVNSYNHSIIDDGNLHTWFMPHNFSIVIPSLTHSLARSPSFGNLRSFRIRWMNKQQQKNNERSIVISTNGRMKFETVFFDASFHWTSWRNFSSEINDFYFFISITLPVMAFRG